MLFLAATGEDDVLLAELDLLHGRPDAVGAGRARGGDRVVHALDLERRGEARRNGTRHRARHHVRPDALHAAAPERVGARDDVLARRAARRRDEAGARIGDVALFQTGVLDGPLHRDVGISGRVTHETQHLAIDMLLDIDIDAAGDQAAQAHLLEVLVIDDAGSTVLQGIGDLISRITKTRHRTDAGDNDSPHEQSFFLEVIG